MKILYRYDALDRLVEAVWENGKRVSYVYDAAGNRLATNPTGPAPAAAPAADQRQLPEQQPAALICSTCGASLSAAAKFCPRCGARRA